jgi:hypothetical protein
MRSRYLWPAVGAAAVIVGGLVGLAAARADNLMPFTSPKPAEPAVYHSDNTPMQDRLLAKTAFTEVLAHRSQTLGMIAPSNLAPYAPIFPDGLILDEAMGDGASGKVQYDAAGSLRTLVDFYADAAALHHLSFQTRDEGPDTVLFTASDGHRQVQARLTRQFANGTVVDLSYS